MTTPSPAEARKRIGHVLRFMNLLFEVQLPEGTWRMVRVGRRQPLFNRVMPELSLLAFGLYPWPATSYLPEIYGVFYASRVSFERGHVEWVPTTDISHLAGRTRPGDSVTVGFRALNADAEAWFVLLLAKAAKARFRSRQFLRDDRFDYTREP